MSPTNLLQFITDDDIPYEQAILKNPFDLDSWLNYIRYKEGHSIDSQVAVLNRAVACLNRSYKLWMIYLRLRVSLLKQNQISSIEEVGIVRKLFEKCLQNLYKFPVVWIEFLEFLIDYLNYCDVGYIRRVFNDALQNLTVIQHHKIWKLYLKFADLIGDKVSFLIYYKYFEYKLKTDGYEESINKLTTIEEDITFEFVLDRLVENVSNTDQLLKLDNVFEKLVKSPKFLIKLSKSELDLHVQYFDVLIALVKKSKVVNFKEHDLKIINFFNKMELTFPDQLGKFTVKLANYWIIRKEFVKVIDTFESGLLKSITLKDFTMIYDAYVEFEDARVTKLANKVDKLETNPLSNPNEIEKLNVDLNILFTRFEALLKRRKFLVSDVLLRQNVNNVQEWLNRIGLYDEDTEIDNILDCYATAIKSIDPLKVSDTVIGSELKGSLLSKLWIDYASVYEKHQDIDSSRMIYNIATNVPFKNIDDLVKIWIEWAEMEIRNDDFDHAVYVIKKPIEIPNNLNVKNVHYNDTDLSSQLRIHKSVKLWSFYLDLIESCGDLKEVCQVYDQVLDMKLATPLTIINYANYLEENEHYEECFKIYERGVYIFKYPTVFEIWNHYLLKIVEYKDKLNINVERIRDLFEQSLENCPKNLNKAIYLLYANFEETKGSKLKSLKVYQEGIKNSDSETDKIEMYKVLIIKTIEFENLKATRPIYEKALESLSVRVPGFIDTIIMGFVNVELKLGQLKRCREILEYGSELVMKYCKFENDRVQMWESWKQFELDNGDEESYKKMLRYKRHLENISKPILKGVGGGGESVVEKKVEPVGFVASSDGPKVTSISLGGVGDLGEENDVDQHNPDQIELDLSDLE